MKLLQIFLIFVGISFFLIILDSSNDELHPTRIRTSSAEPQDVSKSREDSNKNVSLDASGVSALLPNCKQLSILW